MKNLLLIAFLALIYGGLHTQFAVVYGGHMLIPFVLCGAGALGIIVLFPNRFSLTVLRWFAVLSGLLAIMAIITAMQAGELGQRLVSAADFVYSLILAYSAFVGISALGLRWCSRFFLTAALFLILGSLLEVYGGLRPVSDAFREATQQWHSEYSGVYGGVNGDIRDEILYGAVRPKFFALEPSILGISAGTAILYWFLASGTFTMRRTVAAACFAALAFLLIRSPTILLCLLMICEFFIAETFFTGASRASRALIGIGTLVAVAAFPFVTTVLVHYTHGGSFLAREIVPAVMAITVLRSHPLFGTGIGGYQEWGQFAFSAINSKWGFVASRELFSTLITGGPYAARFLVSNGLWEFWIDCGIVGGAAVLFCVLRMLRDLRVPHPVFVLCIAAIAFTTIGGVTSAAEWIPLFSVAALYREHRIAREGSAGGSGSSSIMADKPVAIIAPNVVSGV